MAARVARGSAPDRDLSPDGWSRAGKTISFVVAGPAGALRAISFLQG
jgi:hypothetical protein